MNFKKTFKRLAALLTATCLMTAVAGCVSKPSEVSENVFTPGPELSDLISSTTGEVPLKVWVSDGNEALVTGLTEKFKTLYPSVTFNITVENFTSDEIVSKMCVDVLGGADVYTLEDSDIDTLIGAGALGDIKTYYTYNPTETNVKGSVITAQREGKLTCYPYSVDNGYFLYYNSKIYSAEDVASFDSMISKAQETDTYISLNVSDGWYLYGFFAAAGYEVDSETCTWDKQGATSIAEGIMTLYESGRVFDLNDSDTGVGVMSGKISAFVSGMWREDTTEYAWGSNMKAAVLPEFTADGQSFQTASFAEYTYYGVNPYSRQTEWSSVLAEYLSGKESQLAGYLQKGIVPCNNEAFSDDALKTDVCASALHDQCVYADPMRVGDEYWEASSRFGAILSSGDLNGQSLQDLMYDITDEILGKR